MDNDTIDNTSVWDEWEDIKTEASDHVRCIVENRNKFTFNSVIDKNMKDCHVVDDIVRYGKFRGISPLEYPSLAYFVVKRYPENGSFVQSQMGDTILNMRVYFDSLDITEILFHDFNGIPVLSVPITKIAKKGDLYYTDIMPLKMGMITTVYGVRPVVDQDNHIKFIIYYSVFLHASIYSEEGSEFCRYPRYRKSMIKDNVKCLNYMTEWYDAHRIRPMIHYREV